MGRSIVGSRDNCGDGSQPLIMIEMIVLALLSICYHRDIWRRWSTLVIYDEHTN